MLFPYGICDKQCFAKRQKHTNDDYQRLLGKRAWSRLSPVIRERFTQHQYPQNTRYTGTMHTVWRSTTGALFAQCCRLIGTPLALHSENNVPIDVHVYEDKHLGGMTWDRYYHYRNHPADRVTSTKRIEANGLVECVGKAFGMKLRLTENKGALCFTSEHYFFRLGRLRCVIPQWLSPGRTQVMQKDLGNGQFQFTLTIEHSLLGRTFFQTGVFSECQSIYES